MEQKRFFSWLSTKKIRSIYQTRNRLDKVYSFKVGLGLAVFGTVKVWGLGMSLISKFEVCEGLQKSSKAI